MLYILNPNFFFITSSILDVNLCELELLKSYVVLIHP